jgi:hypothetical protein
MEIAMHMPLDLRAVPYRRITNPLSTLYYRLWDWSAAHYAERKRAEILATLDSRTLDDIGVNGLNCETNLSRYNPHALAIEALFYRNDR